jgi:hypothetical protein
MPTSQNEVVAPTAVPVRTLPVRLSVKATVAGNIRLTLEAISAVPTGSMITAIGPPP